MTNVSAPGTFDDINLRATPRLVPALIALEAYFLGALEGVVRVLAAEDAGGEEGVVGAVLLLVTDLLAIVALDGRIVFGPVALSFLLLHVVEGVILVSFVVSLLLVQVVEGEGIFVIILFRILVLLLLLIIIFVLAFVVRAGFATSSLLSF